MSSLTIDSGSYAEMLSDREKLADSFAPWQVDAREDALDLFDAEWEARLERAHEARQERARTREVVLADEYDFTHDDLARERWDFLEEAPVGYFKAQRCPREGDWFGEDVDEYRARRWREGA
jgi:hypothetical protein